MQHAKVRNLRPRLLALAAAALLMALSLPLVSQGPSVAVAAQSDTVKYALSLSGGDSPGLEVTVSFSLRQGERVLLAPELETGAGFGPGTEPRVELEAGSDARLTVEPTEPPDQGWAVTAGAAGEYSVPYTVRFPSLDTAVKDSRAPEGEVPPRAIAEEDLKVFRGSDALLVPRRGGGRPVSTSFVVDLPLEARERALVPWKALDRDSFSVNGETSLMENYLSWGALETSRLKARGAILTTAYSSEVTLSAEERRLNDQALVTMYDHIADRVGERPRLDQLTVLVCDAGRFGLDESSHATGVASVVLFPEGEKLSGVRAAAAAGGLFSLWNRYFLVPRRGGEAAWFQAGLEVFYPLRVAAMTGLMDSDAAFTEFSRAYRSSLTDPLAGSVSLTEAEGRPEATALLRNKGAAVIASLSRRLQDESRGSVKDIDWLLGRLAKRFDHFEGKDYTMVDISESVEDATGRSWDRYFAGRVDGEQDVLSSEFSQSDMFGSTSFTGGVVTGRGSGRSWLYLLIAILIIFLIPIIFSAYVRRAVKLEVTMPKILPEEDE